MVILLVKKLIKKVGRPILITVLVFVTLSFTVTKLIYDSSFRRYDPPPRELSSWAQERQELDFPSDGELLQGYFYDSPKKDVLLVLAPGFHAGADDYLEQIRQFSLYGWGVFAFDPLGSCESGGSSHVGFPQELLDLEAALAFVQGKDFFGYEHLVLFGHSRGGYAVCCAAASEFPIDAVISVGGVNSAMEGVIEPAAQRIGPLAYVNYPFLWAYQALLFGPETVNLDAAQILSHSEVPALIIHGTGDTRVSPHAYSIYSYEEEILSEEVEFFTMDRPGQDGHVDLLVDADGSANDILMEQIEDFIRRNSD